MHQRILLDGPVLMGFADLFDEAWGRPHPSAEIPTLTPTCIGGATLPWPCPHCGAIRPVMADSKKRDAYRDPWRGFFWCPACRGRYRLDATGAPPAASIPAGAAAGPARVTVGGRSYVLDVRRGSVVDDLDMLEAA